jgi:hypothetical protein
MADPAANGERRALQPGKTVVLCLDTLGDLTLRQPLLSGLVDAGFPVSVVVRKGYETLVPFLDPRLQVLVTEINPYDSTPPTPESVDDLHRRIMDCAPVILVSALVDWTSVDDELLRRFQGRRVGLVKPTLPDPGTDDPRRRLMDHPVDCPIDTHESEKNNALLLAITGQTKDPYLPVLSLPEEARAQAAAVLKDLGLEPGRYVVGSPAGTAQTPYKAWPPDDYAALADHLRQKHGLAVLVTGTAGEAAQLSAVAEAARARGTPVKTWIGDASKLGLLLGLVQSARLYLGADTGPMHFAGALGVPVVARFGGGHWPRFLPLARRSYVGTQAVPCFGCGWACWLDNPVCVRHGPTQSFRDAVDWILSGSAPERRVDTGETIGPAGEAVLNAARAAKQKSEDELTAKVVTADDYRKWLEARFAELDEYRKRVETDFAALSDYRQRLETDIAALDAYRKQLEAVAQERLELMETLGRDLAASEADRAARLDVIREQERILRPFGMRAMLKILRWLRVV